MFYVRYHHVRMIINKENNHFNMRKINTIAYIIGLIACFGISIVGNFQVIIFLKKKHNNKFISILIINNIIYKRKIM